MWIFASQLPVNAIVLSPRGLYESPMGGYSWYQKRDKAWPVLNDFNSAINSLTDVLTTDFFPKGDFSQFRMLGFSLGAALVYSFALKQAKPLRALAGLSGFVPDGATGLEEARPLQDLAVFIAHGTRDQLVPIERGSPGRRSFTANRCNHFLLRTRGWPQAERRLFSQFTNILPNELNSPAKLRITG